MHLAYPIPGMFHLREHSLSHSDKVNAGAKTANARQQPMSHRCVLAALPLLLLICSLFPFLLLAYLPRVTIRAEVRFLILRINLSCSKTIFLSFHRRVN